MLVGLENSALLPPRNMLRVHYTIRKDQRFGKGKADDQGRQLVSISAIPTPQSLTPFVRSVLSPLGGDKRNSSRDSAELPIDQAVNPICSDFQSALSSPNPAASPRSGGFQMLPLACRHFPLWRLSAVNHISICATTHFALASHRV